MSEPPGRYAELDAAIRARVGRDEFSGVVLLRRGDDMLFEAAVGRASRWSRSPTRYRSSCTSRRSSRP
jgi:hypothetical protein